MMLTATMKISSNTAVVQGNPVQDYQAAYRSRQACCLEERDVTVPAQSSVTLSN